MKLEQGIHQLTHNARRLEALVQGVSAEQARWRPSPADWSILEVINHCADEEQADFRVRLDIILHRPDQPWPPIDPPGWVTERHYNQRELAESLNRFLAARRESLAWLAGLISPNWAAGYEAPFGPITAGDMFAAWQAHDLLHLRQLVELQWFYLESQVTPSQVDYAGEW